MAATFELSILTPEHTFYQGLVEMLTVQAQDGKTCIWAGCAPAVIALAEGELLLRDANRLEKRAAASDGFITVTQDQAVVMLQSAEWPEDIDRVRAERAERRAREALLHKQDRQSHLMNQATLLRAMTRLRVSSRRNVNHS
ncbi:MAG: F0F1 ATP synthase subunit epsilon [Clostridia bacterium]|nr:F0F1 ATP synthase subunit epsilon [Clostridia bacterium]